MENQFPKWTILTLIVKDGMTHKVRVGHTLIQKVVYLLQNALDVDVGYNFKLYHYGPYSEELWGDLRILSDLGIVSIVTDPNGYGYRISIDDQEKAKLFQRFGSDSLNEKINEVMELLRNRDSRSLELLATTHFVYSDLVAKNRQATPSDVANYVTKLKPHFNSSQAEHALGTLQEQNWLS